VFFLGNRTDVKNCAPPIEGKRYLVQAYVSDSQSSTVSSVCAVGGGKRFEIYNYVETFTDNKCFDSSVGRASD
jgi:hypothetical protein